MFKLLALFLVFCAFSADSTSNLPTQEEYEAEMRAAGMSQSGIDGLHALSQKFVKQYPLVQSNPQAANKFISDYTVEVQSFIKAMSPADQKIYADSLKKYGLA